MQQGIGRRAGYFDTIEVFRGARTEEVLGALLNATNFSVLETQRDAWRGHSIHPLPQLQRGRLEQFDADHEYARIGGGGEGRAA